MTSSKKIFIKKMTSIMVITRLIEEFILIMDKMGTMQARTIHLEILKELKLKLEPFL